MSEPYVLQEAFLTDGEYHGLLAYAISRRRQFVPSTVSTGDTSYRRSEVLYDAGLTGELVKEQVRSLVPAVLPLLGIEPFPIGEVEGQITASGDGAYFHRHNDSGSPDTILRRLTYVYYFHRLPRGFDGGELVLFDALGGVAAELVPIANSIVFFPSSMMHAVLSVTVPSGEFGDGRLTLNGWVREDASAGGQT